MDTDIAAICRQLKASGKKIVFTNGCFDIIHAGHVRYLRQAKNLGDCLIVGLNSDSSVKKLKGEDRPINNECDRAEVLGELKAVDYVVIFEELTAEKIIAALKPDIYAKGGDYTPQSLPEAPVVAAYGGEIKILPFVDGKSTTGIINKIKS
jgi:glycerol-3-phosphate cytidylyltransferase